MVRDVVMIGQKYLRKPLNEHVFATRVQVWNYKLVVSYLGLESRVVHILILTPAAFTVTTVS